MLGGSININRDSGIEIPEAWMPTIKKHNNRRASGPPREQITLYSPIVKN